MRLATIDVGTNTTLLLVAEIDAGGAIRVLADRAEITRLGRGIGGDGRLRPEGVARTIHVLRDYAAVAAEHGARVAAIGTEALRRAPNAPEFLAAAAQVLGAPVEVIDGEREAALAFLAAARSFPQAATGAVAVIDIGGGSTEVVLADAGAIRFRASFPLGSVRLHERHVRHDPPGPAEAAAIRAEAATALAGVPWARLDVLVGTAGTVTTLSAMAQRLASYDPARVHGHRLSRAALAEVIATLERSTQAERERMPGLDPRRADVIFAGAILLSEIMRCAATAEVLVSDRGIRWGLLYEACNCDNQ